MRYPKRTLLLVCFMAISMTMPAVSLAGSAKKDYKLKPGEEWKAKSETIQGAVISLTTSRIVLEYGYNKKAKSIKEIQLDLPAEGNINFVYLKRLEDMKWGDTVKVTYLDEFVENQEGKLSQYKRIVTDISLIKSSANKSMVSR